MRSSHDEVKEAVWRSLETYLRVLGPRALDWYADYEGEWQDLNEVGWAFIRNELLGEDAAIVCLTNSQKPYRFEYFGPHIHHPTFGPQPDAVRAVEFRLPTEYLEEHGPGRVRELALELASALPFASGHAGLAFHAMLDVAGVDDEIKKWCFRYPGLDIIALDTLAFHLGTQVRAPSWLTFLGQPVLGELGGASGLRARLHSEGTTVQELEGERAVVTLGPWPEAGDTEQGQTLPAYRELVRVLEPWLYFRKELPGVVVPPDYSYYLDRWERRFLD
jgi:hypothetical protein